ncbi:hypothetical protein [Actinomadura rupiterrae]|uniref:hypothetical protein n=1 Tax=Actinomadura rupiterrae TaxID=559627 RepID=UPI0020A3DF60|nr:hypothetical protein [Actinomadura rupiterrae]MCP2338700.1 NADPH:quinone reductase-like Zn-dependent oxidoreductase [Actinomadura rupiterrae]
MYALLDFAGSGGAADYVTIPAAQLAAKPTTTDRVAASSLPLAALTAWQSFTDHAHLAPGRQPHFVPGLTALGLNVLDRLVHPSAPGQGRFAMAPGRTR